MPHALEKQVGSLLRNLRRRHFTLLASQLFLLILGLFLTVGIFDYLVQPYDTGIRWLMSVLFLGLVIFGAQRLIRQAWRKRWSLFRTARLIESKHPSLQDRVTNSLEFLHQDEKDLLLGSTVLRRVTIAETTGQLQNISFQDLSQEIPLKKSARFFIVLSSLLLLLFLFNSSAVTLAARRILMPWETESWPRQHYLMFESAPKQILVGETFSAKLHDRSGKLPSQIKVLFRYKLTGRWITEPLTLRGFGDSLLVKRENVLTSFSYKAIGGDDPTMPWQKVQVVTPPKVEAFSITTFPPKYSGLPSQQVGANFRVLSRSALSLTGKTEDSLLTSATLEHDSIQIAPLDLTVEKTSFSSPQNKWKVLYDENRLRQKFRLKLTTADLLAFQDPTSETSPKALQSLKKPKQAASTGAYTKYLGSYQVDQDRSPQIFWKGETGIYLATPRSYFPVQLRTEDDLAVHKIDLTYHLVSKSKSSQDNRSTPEKSTSPKSSQTFDQVISLYDAGPTPKQHASYPPLKDQLISNLDWDLLTLKSKLKPGDLIQIRVTATDYLAQTTRSQLRTVQIVTRSVIENKLSKQEQAILTLLKETLTTEQTSLEQTTSLETIISDATKWQISHQNLLRQIRFQQREVVRRIESPTTGMLDRIQHLSDTLVLHRLDDSSIQQRLDSLFEELSEIRKTPLASANRSLASVHKLAQLDLENNRPEIAQLLTAILSSQQTVITRLEKILESYSHWLDYRRLVQELAEIHTSQAELSLTTLDQFPPGKHSVLQKHLSSAQQIAQQLLTQRQQSLRRRITKLMVHMRHAALTNAALSNKEITALRSATDLAEDQTLVEEMRTAQKFLARNQVAQSLVSQKRTILIEQEMLDLLRNQVSTQSRQKENKELQALLEKLRKLQAKLADLQKKVALKNSSPKAKADLKKLAKKLAQQAEEIAKAMQKKSVSASKHIKKAASLLNKKPEQSSLKKAADELKKVENKLAQKIRRQQQDLAKEQLKILADLVPSWLKTEQLIAKKMLHLKSRKPLQMTAEEYETVQTQSAEQQKKLAQQIQITRKIVTELPVFQIALEQLLTTIEKFNQNITTRKRFSSANEAVVSLVTQLQQLVDALKDPVSPPSPKQQDKPAPPKTPQPPKRTPKQDQQRLKLAELKLLRTMQHQLNNRTRLFDLELTVGKPLTPAQKTTAEKLGTEQNSLAKLVDKIMRELILLSMLSDNLQPEEGFNQENLEEDFQPKNPGFHPGMPLPPLDDMPLDL